jgi:putative heme iron utilization protein
MTAIETPDPIAEASLPITRHINGEHTDNLIEYLRAFADVHDATDARMTGVDRDGFDIDAQTPGGPRAVRIPWPQPLERREQVREEMVRMTVDAKAKLGLAPIDPQEH